MIKIANLSKLIQTQSQAQSPEVIQNVINQIENADQNVGKTFDEILQKIISQMNSLEKTNQKVNQKDANNINTSLSGKNENVQISQKATVNPGKYSSEILQHTQQQTSEQIQKNQDLPSEKNKLSQNTITRDESAKITGKSMVDMTKKTINETEKTTEVNTVNTFRNDIENDEKEQLSEVLKKLSDLPKSDSQSTDKKQNYSNIHQTFEDAKGTEVHLEKSSNPNNDNLENADNKLEKQYTRTTDINYNEKQYQSRNSVFNEHSKSIGNQPEKEYNKKATTPVIQSHTVNLKENVPTKNLNLLYEDHKNYESKEVKQKITENVHEKDQESIKSGNKNPHIQSEIIQPHVQHTETYNLVRQNKQDGNILSSKTEETIKVPVRNSNTKKLLNESIKENALANTKEDADSKMFEFGQYEITKEKIAKIVTNEPERKSSSITDERSSKWVDTDDTFIRSTWKEDKVDKKVDKVYSVKIDTYVNQIRNLSNQINELSAFQNISGIPSIVITSKEESTPKLVYSNKSSETFTKRSNYLNNVTADPLSTMNGKHTINSPVNPLDLINLPRLIMVNSKGNFKVESIEDSSRKLSDMVKEIRIIQETQLLRGNYKKSGENKARLEVQEREVVFEKKNIESFDSLNGLVKFGTQNVKPNYEQNTVQQDFQKSPLNVLSTINSKGNPSLSETDQQNSLRNFPGESLKNNLEVSSFKVEYKEKINDTNSSNLSEEKPKISDKFVERLAQLTYKAADQNMESHSTQTNKLDFAERLQASRNLEQIYERIKEFSLSNMREERVQMKLVPENLGNLDVELKKEGRQLSITFITENEKAKEMLEKSIQVLRERLANLDFEVRSVEIRVKEDEKYYEHDRNSQHGQHREHNEGNQKRKYTYEEVTQDDDERERDI
ncbi:MAG: flagellar hook-length control protein FliK [Fervidobacterium sp.]